MIRRAKADCIAPKSFPSIRNTTKHNSNRIPDLPPLDFQTACTATNELFSDHLHKQGAQGNLRHCSY